MDIMQTNTMKAVQELIEQPMQHYEKYGYLFFHKIPWWENPRLQIPFPAIKKTCVDIVMEQKRQKPVIATSRKIITGWGKEPLNVPKYITTTEVTAPNTKRLWPIFGIYRVSGDALPLGVKQLASRSVSSFSFNEDAFEEFHTRITTDPYCREVLGLPPK